MRVSLLVLAAFASLPRGSVFEGNGPRQSLVGGHSASNNGRSKYEPHQVKQEIALRLKRMNHGLPR